MPHVWNNRGGPQAREPSKCLNGQSFGERLVKEAFQLPDTRGSKKKTLIGPLILRWRQSVSLQSWCHQGPCKPRSCATFTLDPYWDRAATGKEVLHLSMQGCFGHVQLFAMLWTVACQTSLSGGSPGKNTGVYWPILVAIPF